MNKKVEKALRQAKVLGGHREPKKELVNKNFWVRII